MTRPDIKLVVAWATALAVSANLFAAAAEQSDKIGVTDSAIVVGSCAPLTGQQKIRGQEVVAGGRAYFSYINDQGGVNGRKIKLVGGDDLYSGDGAEHCFFDCINNKAFLGTLFSGTAAAARLVPKSDQFHVPMVGFSTGAEFIVNPIHPYIFQIRPSYRDEAAEMVKTLQAKAGMRKIALIYQGDAFGAQCRNGVISALKQLNSAPVLEIQYVRLTENIDPIIAQVKTAAPEVVIIGGGGDAAILFTKKLLSMKMPVALFSSSTDLLTKQAPQDSNGALITETLPLLHSELPTVQLYKRVLSKYEHKTPTAGSFEGFLIAMTVVEGLKRAGKDLTREKFVQALESVHNLDIGLGQRYKIDFGPKQHCALRSTVTWTSIHNGRLEPFTDWDSLNRLAAE